MSREGLTRWFENAFGLNAGIHENILESLLLIAVLVLARIAVLGIIWRRFPDVRVRYTWRKTTTYVAVGLVLVLVGRIWFAGVSSVATFLGLLSAGLAIALKDLVANLAGWAFIVWRRPFRSVTGSRSPSTRGT